MAHSVPNNDDGGGGYIVSECNERGIEWRLVRNGGMTCKTVRLLTKEKESKRERQKSVEAFSADFRPDKNNIEKKSKDEG